MDLKDLRQSLSSMTEEQLLATLKEVRQSRRVGKKPTTAKKAAQKADTAELLKALASMSAEDKASVLAQLTGGGKK